MLNSLWFVDQQPCGMGRSAESWATLWPTEMDYLGMEPRDLIKCFRWRFWHYSVRARCVRGASLHVCSLRSVPRSDGCSSVSRFYQHRVPLVFTADHRTPSLQGCRHTADTLPLPWCLPAAKGPSVFPCVPSSTIWALYILQLSLRTFFQVNTHTPDAPELTVEATIFHMCLPMTSH